MYVRYLGWKKKGKKRERLFRPGQEIKAMSKSLQTWLLAVCLHQYFYPFMSRLFFFLERDFILAHFYETACSTEYFSMKVHMMEWGPLYCTTLNFSWVEFRNMPTKVQEWRRVIFSQPCLTWPESHLVLCLWQGE